MSVFSRTSNVVVALALLGCTTVSQGTPAPALSSEATAPPIFTCKTEIGAFGIISGANDTVRLQRPDAPSPIDGSERVEGSSVCAYSIWTFQSEANQYSVSELGCYPDGNPPPDGAKGRLEIRKNGDTKSYWCY
jgi:hypothetical protein